MTRTLAEVEKEQILQAIIEKGSIAAAARTLGITRPAIYRRLAKYGIAIKANEILAELRKQNKLNLKS